MRRTILILSLVLFAQGAVAEIVVANRTIRAKDIITAADLEMRAETVPGAITDPSVLIGNEARVTLYPNRPIRRGDVGPPALVERNQVVPLIYAEGLLNISTEGRALGRGGEGDVIRVMNLSSRSMVLGRVRPDGAVEVQ
jgi:flagella basal body P-ring formation protein FlgA